MDYENFTIKDTCKDWFPDLPGQFVSATSSIFKKGNGTFRLLHINDSRRLDRSFNLKSRIKSIALAPQIKDLIFLPDEWLEPVKIPDTI